MDRGLQKALDYVLTPAEVVALSDEARKAIATVWKEAARKVANPDEATVRILERMNPTEHTPAEWDKAHELALAALGIEEAPDGQ